MTRNLIMLRYIELIAKSSYTHILETLTLHDDSTKGHEAFLYYLYQLRWRNSNVNNVLDPNLTLLFKSTFVLFNRAHKIITPTLFSHNTTYSSSTTMVVQVELLGFPGIRMEIERGRFVEAAVASSLADQIASSVVARLGSNER